MIPLIYLKVRPKLKTISQQQITSQSNRQPEQLIQAPSSPLFIFELSRDTALHNAIVLEQFNFNIDKVIKAQLNSQVQFGPGFKNSKNLQELLEHHPHWRQLKAILHNSATFPLNQISQEDRLVDNIFHRNRGNHKSTVKNREKMKQNIIDDISRGFALPLPIELLHSIPNTSLAPLGCVEQESINELSKKTPKFPMTHDQSFPGPTGNSVNSRVQKENLQFCMYSFVLLRLLHFIIHLRHNHPKTKIFLSKFDLDAAYRRCHLSGSTTSECLTIFDDTLLMALRMTFGGAPCPSMWGYISDTLEDICNKLIHNPYWDHQKFSDSLSSTIEEPSSLPPEIPFHPAKSLAVKIPPNNVGKVNIYIDDSIGVALHTANTYRVNAAIPLAIHSISRPLYKNDPAPRNEMISLKKFRAKGRMEEIKKILGWIVNTHSSTIALPLDKHSKWTAYIETIISTGKCNLCRQHPTQCGLFSWVTIQSSTLCKEIQLDHH
jgi:antitoxin component of MazEF toxin-antitoxin module